MSRVRAAWHVLLGRPLLYKVHVTGDMTIVAYNHDGPVLLTKSMFSNGLITFGQPIHDDSA